VARPSDLRRTLASNIRAALARKNKSIVAAAGLAGVSAAHLYDVIACEKGATIDFIDKIARVLGVEPWQLLRETGDSSGGERSLRKKSRAPSTRA
jgi:transcriptional regulator with XRE-family HTH domain